VKKTALYLFIFVLMAFPVLSAPPNAVFQESGTETGAVILYPKDNYYQQNSEFSFHVHFINGSGYAVNTSNFECIGHFYSSQGSHLAELESIDDSNGWDDYFRLNDTVTGVKQTIPYNIWCNSTQNEGAFVSGSLKINDDSEYDETAGGLIVAIILIGIFYLLMKIAVNIDEERHAVMKLLFILVSIWFAVGSLGLAKFVAVTNSGIFDTGALNVIDGLYLALITVSIVLTLYFVIYYVFTVLDVFSKLSKRGGKDR